MKVIVFGAGLFGKQYISNLKDEEIVAVCDNNWKTINSFFGYKIISPEKILEMEFDYVVIAIDCGTITGKNNINEILHQLKELGISEQKILLSNGDVNICESIGPFKYPRINFLYDFAKLVYEKNIEGSIAECGVHLGSFSYHINRAFPDRKLYLFDSFEGFRKQDLELEDISVRNHLMKNSPIKKEIQDEKYAWLKCQFRDNVIIKKGYIPDTFYDLPEEKFAYVHLDMDIYAPIIAGLKFFAPRMSKGGVIAVHDYGPNGPSNNFWTGCRKAVNEFCNNNSNRVVPIGDGTSLLILF